VDEEQDIKPDGEPAPDNADPKFDGESLKDKSNAPFEANNEDIEITKGAGEDPDLIAEDISEIGTSMESALESIDNEDTSPDIQQPTPYDPEESTGDGYDEPPKPPTEPDAADDGVSPIRESSSPLDRVRNASMTEAPPPSAGEMASITEALDGLGAGGEDDTASFEEQVNDFNEAGGADDGGDSSLPRGSSGDSDGSGIGSFAGASVRHAEQQDDMLREYARRLDEMTRGLENERL